MATKVDEWTPLVITSLKARFGEDKTGRLMTLLKDNEGLIAGGFILGSCLGLDNKGQDVDFYVPVKNIPRFINTLVVDDPINGASIMKPTHYNSYAASFYCESFLKKNGIRKVYNFAIGKMKARKREAPFLEVTEEIDIMAVRNKRGPLAVVQNFDLTFCQVWFDGTDVYATHPDHIRNKSGVLQIDYCKMLLSGNRFLKRRINKYIWRGFKVDFSEDLGKTIEVVELMKIIGRSVTRRDCTGGHRARRLRDPVFAERWFNRVAMRWFLNIRDGVNKDDESLYVLAVPLIKDILNNQIQRVDRNMDLGKNTGEISWHDMGGKPGGIQMDSYVPDKDDGYDSEDMDTTALQALAKAHFVQTADELAVPVSDELIYKRGLTGLFLNSQTKVKGYSSLYDIQSYHRHYHRDDSPTKPYLEFIRKKCLESGDDYLGSSGELFHIHSHPLDGAITAEGLEGYLESTMTGDTYDVPCYWTPEPVVRGQPMPAKNCQHNLTLDLIKKIVSPEFYERYSAPRPMKEGLDQEVGLFESVFKNVKTTDTLGYGDIYHSTMCPFCLKFEERAEGCAYMTHENPKRLPYNKSPFCKPERDTGLLGKYIGIAGALGEDYIHMEFCVECGRPCINHKHINLEGTALIENQQIPDPDHPGQMKIDYGNCPGGGRQEMVARMLAVRDVYRRKNIRDVQIERNTAAVAADKAPLNATLMARAKAILDKPVTERAFNKPIGSTKKYTNAIYDESVNDDSKEGLWDESGPTAAPPAARPNVPASSEQKHWNQQNLDYISHMIDTAFEFDAINDDIQDKILTLRAIALNNEQAENDDEHTQIDLNLVNALAWFYKTVNNPQFKDNVKHKLWHAYLLGGERVKAGLDPEIGYVMEDPDAVAPAGGKRKTYKRRKGLLKRKALTRKNK